MKKIITAICLVTIFTLLAQPVTLNPTITPAVFGPNDDITISYNTMGTSLATLTNAWIWVWIPGKNINAKYNINPATSAADPAKFIKNGTIYSITFKPSNFFASSITSESQMGVLLKATDWPNGQTTDYIANFGFQAKLIAPTANPVFVNVGDNLNIQVDAPQTADFNLYIDNVLTDTKLNLLSYTYSLPVAASPSVNAIRITAKQKTGTMAVSEVVFQYVLHTNSPNVVRPPGIIAGINYNNTDATKATLCLWAPGKSSVYATGDFSNWDVLPAHLMNRDGEYFWLELNGLTASVEYGFQYLVDETIRVADPFADKILDPDDQYIPSASYPNLKIYPAKAKFAEWYKNRVSVFQTNQIPYMWQASNFEKPKKESLVIYELLLRDYFDSGNRNYQTLMDTLPYLTRLGINAIELMPIMEFNGNESWGYNPTFMFAPDKYYGTKDKLKEFVDKCHQNGIAVILDIAMNHQDAPNAMAMLDFDFNNFKPTPNNKWFNVNATHPYSVFSDMNHESAYTKKYLDTINYYWINQFKVDGFRFDLSKGFTQTNSGSDVTAWGNYDVSRIAILKRMADKIWSHSPNAFVILEHFAANSEEKELAEYRAGENKGIMLWGNLTNAYNQNTMGYATDNDITGISSSKRGWAVPHLVGYMESHDEERLMYKNLQYGNSLSTYNIKTLSTALQRIKAATTIFYTVPGPKMLWQFGELGFDYSINRCQDGTTNNDCRLSIKPSGWSFQEEGNRVSLFNRTADMIRLKKSYNVFQNGAATFSFDNLVQQVSIKNINYTITPPDSTQMSAVIVVNFDVQAKDVAVVFPHSGNWYEYFTREINNISGSSLVMTVNAGQAKIFTNVEIRPALITGLASEFDLNTTSIYPNPTEDFIQSTLPLSSLILISVTGVKYNLHSNGEHVWDARAVQPGLYIAVAEINGSIKRTKIIKK